MREGQGPGFLEAVTYRWRSHVGPDENIDVGVRRKVEGYRCLEKRDPIRRLADAMVAAGIMDNNAFKAVQTNVETEISIAVENARTAPYPGNNALTDYVFATGAAAMSVSGLKRSTYGEAILEGFTYLLKIMKRFS